MSGMIGHFVCVRLHDPSPANVSLYIDAVKAAAAAISFIKRLDIGANVRTMDGFSGDIAFLMLMESRSGKTGSEAVIETIMNHYAPHPAQQELQHGTMPMIAELRVVDYEA